MELPVSSLVRTGELDTCIDDAVGTKRVHHLRELLLNVTLKLLVPHW